jgi:hypothetical protein
MAEPDKEQIDEDLASAKRSSKLTVAISGTSRSSRPTWVEG